MDPSVNISPLTKLLHRATGALTMLLSVGPLLLISWVLITSWDQEGMAFFIGYTFPFVPFLVIGVLGALLWLKFSKAGWAITLMFYAFVYTLAILLFSGGTSSASSIEAQMKAALKGQELLFTVPFLVSLTLWQKPVFYQNNVSLNFQKLFSYLIITFSILLIFLAGLNPGLRHLIIIAVLAIGLILLRSENKYLLILNLVLFSTVLFLYWYPCFSGPAETNVPHYSINPGTGESKYVGPTLVPKTGCGWRR